MSVTVYVMFITVEQCSAKLHKRLEISKFLSVTILNSCPHLDKIQTKIKILDKILLKRDSGQTNNSILNMLLWCLLCFLGFSSFVHAT